MSPPSNLKSTSQDQRRLAGFTVTGGPWRSVRCNACGKATGYQSGLDLEAGVEARAAAHRCGPIGTRWDQAPTAPGPAVVRSLELSAVIAAVNGDSSHLYIDHPWLASKLAELLEAGQSKLDEAAVVVGLRPPGPGEASYLAVAHARRLEGRLELGDPVVVSLGELVDLGCLPDIQPRRWPDGALATQQLAPLGVSWPGFEQCARHAVEDLDRTALAYDAGMLGVVVYDDEFGEPECASCAAEASAENPTEPAVEPAIELGAYFTGADLAAALQPGPHDDLDDDLDDRLLGAPGIDFEAASRHPDEMFVVGIEPDPDDGGEAA